MGYLGHNYHNVRCGFDILTLYQQVETNEECKCEQVLSVVSCVSVVTIDDGKGGGGGDRGWGGGGVS